MRVIDIELCICEGLLQGAGALELFAKTNSFCLREVVFAHCEALKLVLLTINIGLNCGVKSAIFCFDHDLIHVQRLCNRAWVSQLVEILVICGSEKSFNAWSQYQVLASVSLRVVSSILLFFEVLVVLRNDDLVMLNDSFLVGLYVFGFNTLDYLL